MGKTHEKLADQPGPLPELVFPDAGGGCGICRSKELDTCNRVKPRAVQLEAWTCGSLGSLPKILEIRSENESAKHVLGMQAESLVGPTSQCCKQVSQGGCYNRD